ncbi:MAG: UDP-2,3-diacylglucosamine diphosphatase [Succinivibrionaceae bacterium]|nr:UDP-2,3-diacylglucosamine diphosphatase [Succinivibrionaceae bacterium]
MAAYVIADLHLSEHRPALLAALRDFIGHLLMDDRLIIAGDLFDYFVGVSESDPLHQAVRDLFHEAADHGVQVLFQHGNRDFLMNRADAAWLGVRLLPPLFVLTTTLGPMLIMHGDQLCTNDHAYQRARKIFSWRWLQAFFRMFPYSTREGVALTMREHSKRSKAVRSTDPNVFRVVNETMAQALASMECVALVHGHVHAFAQYHDPIPGCKIRMVLGAWGRKFSYVRADSNGVTTAERPLESLKSAQLLL